MLSFFLGGINMGYKLPYISDKNLYFAVKGACSWIKESGYFNKAVNYYSNKYNVDSEEVSKYVRIAQANGQKNKTRGTFKYFAIHGNIASDISGFADYYSEDLASWFVVKALNAENAIKQIFKKLGYNDYDFWFAVGKSFEFETKEDAEDYVKKHTT